jgi:hypothetical protein
VIPNQASAVQLTDDADWEAIAEWCGADLCNRAVADSGEYETHMVLVGGPSADEGDWIIKTADGFLVARDVAEDIRWEALEEASIRADERERIARELETEAATHLYTIRRAFRWAVWVVRGKPAEDDPGSDAFKAEGYTMPCCPVETAAVAKERERIARLAEQVDAFYDAPCPDGDPGCVHQDTPFADLIRRQQ